MVFVNECIVVNKFLEKLVDFKKFFFNVFNNGKDFDVDFKKDEVSFFGSFFFKDKVLRKCFVIMEVLFFVIKFIVLFNEWELMEMDVISR